MVPAVTGPGFLLQIENGRTPGELLYLISMAVSVNIASSIRKDLNMADEKADKGQESKKRGKKINKMTLSEINTKLEEIKGSMGGHTSRYARQLVLRKSALSPK